MNKTKRIWISVVLIIALSLILLLFQNCATIVRGSSQKISFNSTPPSAKVIINGEVKGTTPTSLILKRNKEYQVIFRLDGYKDVTLNIEKEFKFVPTIIGNIFSWGIIGIVVDLANGSAYQLTPEQLNATLQKMGTAMIQPNPNDKNEIHVVFFTTEDLKRLGE